MNDRHPPRRQGPSEREVVKIVTEWLSASIPLSALGQEIRSHGRARIDLCLLVGEEVVAIEVKCRDWKRAVAQAVLNQYCADRSYIAIWLGGKNAALVQEATVRGLGLISVDEDGPVTVVEAPLSKPHPLLREKIIGLLMTDSV